MKKFVIPAIIILTIVAIGFSVYAGVESIERKKIVHSEEEMISMHFPYEREEAEPDKRVESPSHGDVNVTYKESQKQTAEDVIDIYTDENNVEYQVESETGKVVGYFDNDSLKKEPEEEKAVSLDETEKIVIKGAVTEEQAIKIATAEAKRMYPEEYEKFPFSQIAKRVQDESYFVEFNEKWGKDDFAIARAIRVCVAKNGQIATCVMYNREALADVDESLLDGITMEHMEAFIEEKYPDTPFEILQVNVVNELGKYSLYVGVMVNGYQYGHYYPLG